MTNHWTRREVLAGLGAAALLASTRIQAAPEKAMEGAFVITATPYTETKPGAFEDLAAEVDFLDRCGVQGMVWPQSASEYTELTEDERMQGMEVLGKRARGKKPALVLGVQADGEEEMLRYARHAEQLAPDAVIAMPPKEADSLEDFRHYYRSLCNVAKRPVFIQTNDGAEGIGIGSL